MYAVLEAEHRDGPDWSLSSNVPHRHYIFPAVLKFNGGKLEGSKGEGIIRCDESDEISVL